MTLVFFISLFVYKLVFELYPLFWALPGEFKNASGKEYSIIAHVLVFGEVVATCFLYNSYKRVKSSNEISVKKVLLYFFMLPFFIWRVPISFNHLFTKKKFSKTELVHSMLSGWHMILKALIIVLTMSLLEGKKITYITDVVEFFKFLINFYCIIILVVGILKTWGYTIGNPFEKIYLIYNPIQYWRRWSIFMRKFLMTFYYFPLVKKTRNIHLSILAVFLASAVVHYFRAYMSHGYDIYSPEGYFVSMLAYGFITYLFLINEGKLRKLHSQIKSVKIQTTILVTGGFVTWIGFRFLKIILGNY